MPLIIHCRALRHIIFARLPLAIAISIIAITLSRHISPPLITPLLRLRQLMPLADYASWPHFHYAAIDIITPPLMCHIRQAS